MSLDSVNTERPPKRARISSEETLPDVSTEGIQKHYRNGLFLAPMVRSGTYACEVITRLVSLVYGADLVWGPEVVDKAIIGAERVVNETTGVIDFMRNGRSIWNTHPVEKSRLVYQIGSASPETAVEAARLVAGDVSQIDLNCGCPKHFSISGGFGAALLTDPDRLISILEALVKDDQIKVPISCKIRLLPEDDQTLTLVKRIVATGISMLTVHCRTKEMRSSEPALLKRLRVIVDYVEPFGITVVCNGDGAGWSNLEHIKDVTGVSSIMIARAAEANPSCFSSSGPSSACNAVADMYLSMAAVLNVNFQNAKFCMQSFGINMRFPKSERKAFQDSWSRAKTYQDLAKVLSLNYGALSVKTVHEILIPVQKALEISPENKPCWENRSKSVESKPEEGRN